MKIGFLGGGNMGGALMQGILKAQSPMFEAVMALRPLARIACAPG